MDKTDSCFEEKIFKLKIKLVIYCNVKFIFILYKIIVGVV